MRVVELSDHPGDMLRAARSRRAAGGEPQRRRSEEAAARRTGDLAAARQARDAARGRRQWGGWLRGVLAVWRARRAASPAGPDASPGPVSAREASLAAGVEGERLAAAGLGQALGDEWTLLRGYRNPRGEIDLILAGPRGLFAIEVKHWNATVSCDGDTWWADRYDRHGHHLGRQAMTDATGRSPSVQLGEPAQLLETFLHSRGHQARVQRVVLLTHPRARLGSCTRPTVRLAASVREVLEVVNASPPDIPDSEVTRLAERIRRDHEHYQARRRH